MKVGSLIKKIRLMLNQEEEIASQVPAPPVAAVSGEPLLQGPPPETKAKTQPPTPSAEARPAPAAPLPSPQPKVVRPARALNSSTTPLVGIKDHSDLILQMVGESAKNFVAQASAQKMITTEDVGPSVFHRQDVIALMLGYKLATTAYRIQFKDPSREVLRMVRVAMVSMLLKAGRDHIQQLERKKVPEDQRPIFNLEIAEEHFVQAEKEVQNAIAAAENNAAEPLVGFYASLAPTFIEKQNSEAKFGVLLKNLFVKCAQSLRTKFPA